MPRPPLNNDPKTTEDCHKNYVSMCIRYADSLRNKAVKLKSGKASRLQADDGLDQEKLKKSVERIDTDSETVHKAIIKMTDEATAFAADIPAEIAAIEPPALVSVTAVTQNSGKQKTTKTDEITFLNCSFAYKGKNYNVTFTKGLWVSSKIMQDKEITNPILLEVNRQALSKYFKKPMWAWSYSEEDAAELMGD